MEEPFFSDKAQPPTDADLARVLGRAKRHWDRLVTQVRQAAASGSAAWKHYAGKTGWVFVGRDKRRNLVYLKPRARCFVVSFAFGASAVKAAEQSDLPEQVIGAILASPVYPEGRAVRLDVATAADVAVALKLLTIKVDNCSDQRD